MSGTGAAIDCNHVTVHWAGEPVWLLPERAVWWPGGEALFVADVHLGKAGTYRALGQPVPTGTTDDNLARLDALLTKHGARHLVFLGDLLHAPQGITAELLRKVSDWRLRHQAVAMHLVRGNHDARAGDPPLSLDIAVVDEPWPIGPFMACHHPRRLPGQFVLAGHLHPSVMLAGPARDRARLPCFCVDQTDSSGGEPREGLVVLPAFGAFTGTHGVQPMPNRRLYAVGGGAVWPLPLSAPPAGG
ncbi:MAG TPA: ligase-associated DNA damage response endonuclease PdeM [Candidatus Aquabacterium excrementipullorum]|nr:ligase-associated DNA damage response endonuclease PdeM [Candidatus Aquabacterium excrementipullorum]